MYRLIFKPLKEFLLEERGFLTFLLLPPQHWQERAEPVLFRPPPSAVRVSVPLEKPDHPQGGTQETPGTRKRAALQGREHRAHLTPCQGHFPSFTRLQIRRRPNGKNARRGGAGRAGRSQLSPWSLSFRSFLSCLFVFNFFPDYKIIICSI